MYNQPYQQYHQPVMMDPQRFRLQVNLMQVGLMPQLQNLFDMTTMNCVSMLNQLAGSNPVRARLYELLYHNNLQNQHMVEWVVNATKYAFVIASSNQAMPEAQAAAYGADKVANVVILALAHSDQAMGAALQQNPNARAMTERAAQEAMQTVGQYQVMAQGATRPQMYQQQAAPMFNPGLQAAFTTMQPNQNTQPSRYGAMIANPVTPAYQQTQLDMTPNHRAAMAPYTQVQPQPAEVFVQEVESFERVEMFDAKKFTLVKVNGQYALEKNMDRNAHQRGWDNLHKVPTVHATNSVFDTEQSALVEYAPYEKGSMLSTTTLINADATQDKFVCELYTRGEEEAFAKNSIEACTLQTYHVFTEADVTIMSLYEYSVMYNQSQCEKGFHQKFMAADLSSAVKTAQWLSEAMQDPDYYYAANSVAMHLVKALNEWYKSVDNAAGPISFKRITDVKGFVDILNDEDKTLAMVMTNAMQWKDWLSSNLKLVSLDYSETSDLWQAIVAGTIESESIDHAKDLVLNVVRVRKAYTHKTIEEFGISCVDGKARVTTSTNFSLWTAFNEVLQHESNQGSCTMLFGDSTLVRLAYSPASNDVIFITNIT